MLAGGVPEVVERPDHAGLEVVHLPHVVVAHGQPVQVRRPRRRSVAVLSARGDGARVQVLVHVEHDAVAAFGVPVDAFGDAVQILLAVHTGFGFHRPPRDEEPHEVGAHVGVLAVEVRLGERRHAVRRALGARCGVEAVEDQRTAGVVGEVRGRRCRVRPERGTDAPGEDQCPDGRQGQHPHTSHRSTTHFRTQNLDDRPTYWANVAPCLSSPGRFRQGR